MTDGEPSARIQLDGELRVADLDPGAAHLYGVSAADARGLPLAELLRGDEGSLPWAERAAATRRGEPWRGMEAHRSSSGHRLWVEASLALGADGLELRSHAAKGHQVVQEKGMLLDGLRRCLAAGGVGVWLDDQLDVLDWCPTTRNLLNVPEPVQPTHELFLQSVHPDDRARLAAEIQASMVEDRPLRMTLRLDSPHGYRHVETFGHTINDAQGKILLGAGGVRDVSEEVELRAQVQALREELRQAQRMDVVGRLVGGIAHDFNNLLTGILHCAELLRTTKLTPKQRLDVNEIRGAVDRAAELTGQLLALGRRQLQQRRRVVLDDLVRSAHRLLSRIVGEAVRIELALDAPEGHVHVDPTHLQQVLLNLVVNGAQAMPEGGVLRILSRCERRASGEEWVLLEVRDVGVGIAPDVLQRVFEPFFTTKGVGQGTGLGLSTVRGIVEQHGGSVDIESQVGEGTTVRIRLPRSLEAIESPRAVLSATPLPAQGASVLVVEDEHMVRVLTGRLLEAEGFRVHACESAAAALERAAGIEFDLLLTDVIMPSMSGPALVARLREQRPKLRVLYVSGYPADLIDAKVTLGPRERLLMKPFTREALVERIAELLELS